MHRLVFVPCSWEFYEGVGPLATLNNKGQEHVRLMWQILDKLLQTEKGSPPLSKAMLGGEWPLPSLQSAEYMAEQLGLTPPALLTGDVLSMSEAMADSSLEPDGIFVCFFMEKGDLMEKVLSFLIGYSGLLGLSKAVDTLTAYEFDGQAVGIALIIDFNTGQVINLPVPENTSAIL